jgi:hypothetical protein
MIRHHWTNLKHHAADSLSMARLFEGNLRPERKRTDLKALMARLTESFSVALQPFKVEVLCDFSYPHN